MRVCITAVLVVGCGSQGAEPPAATGSALATKAAPVVVADAAALPKQKPPPTKAEIAQQKKHMKAGWAAQQEKRWADAVREFEAALKVIEADQRALAELGWSAMNAGDFAKARRADEDAIRVAVDPKVKAQGLYNLGVVQQKTGDTQGALKSFLASLKLRPNKTVEQAVSKLGAKPTAEPAFCEKPQTVCDCIIDHAFGEPAPGDNVTCAQTLAVKPPVKGFRVMHVHSDTRFGADWDYLVDEHDQLVGIVGGVYEHGRHYETVKLEKAEVKGVGGHWVLWLETTSSAEATYPAGDEGMAIETETSRDVTLCVVGSDKVPTRCPLRDVPLSETRSVEYIDAPGNRDAHAETTLALELADDGTATVKLVKGASDARIAQLVGPHKLW